jgi:hypothetical protein
VSSGRKLPKPPRVDPKQGKMQQEYWLEVETQTISEEGCIAAYCDNAQPRHGSHAEGGEDESRREVSNQLEGAHDEVA